MLAAQGKSFEGATVSISGSGNVAQFACEKVLDLGGKPVTMSDSPDGFTTLQELTEKWLGLWT